MDAEILLRLRNSDEVRESVKLSAIDTSRSIRNVAMDVLSHVAFEREARELK